MPFRDATRSAIVVIGNGIVIILLHDSYLLPILGDSPADLWGILSEPGNRVQTFFLD